MQQQTAIVIGATGMIGEMVTKILLQDDAFNKVRILVIVIVAVVGVGRTLKMET